MPFFHGMIRDGELRGAARLIGSTMQRARSEAVRRGVDVGIVFNTTANATVMGGSYTLYLDTDNNGALDAGETALEQNSMPNSVALYGSTFTTGSATYDSRGLASRAGGIRLANVKPLYYLISVSTTGNVRIQKASVESDL